MCCTEKTISLTSLYRSFAWVGAVLFGGGYAMLPLLEREVVERRQWCTHKEMAELYALAQVVPGVIAVNTAILIGHRYRGARGAIMAALGMVSVPIIIILAIASFFSLVTHWPLLAQVFAGLRAAVAGLLLATALRMVERGCGMPWEWGLALLACGLTLCGVSGPLGLILGALAVGLVWHAWAVSRERKRAR